jgi:hypothetical protein
VFFSPKKLRIIRNTRGVRRAASPEPNASIEKDQSSCIVFNFFLIVQLFGVDYELSFILLFLSLLTFHFALMQNETKDQALNLRRSN